MAVERNLNTGSGATVELGCGRRKWERDSIGVDRIPLGVNEIVADIRVTPWEWAEDGSCDLILAHQVLEHVEPLIPIMNEVYRIASDDAWVEIIVPWYRAAVAYQDPTHCRFFTERTFRYWEPGFVESFTDYGIVGAFAVAVEDWWEEGNLWQVLRPLKTESDMATFHVAKVAGELYPAPPEIVSRREHGFTGRP